MQKNIDAFPNRRSVQSYTFEFCRQTARTNNAAPVADLAQKPTSTLTVEAVSGRCQIVAMLLAGADSASRLMLRSDA